MTKIPGLPNLFVSACLSFGLLGYLDWLNEKNPSHDNIVLNNVIIITCGYHCDTINGQMIHMIDQDRLEFLRKQFYNKFNEIIRS